MVPRLDRYSHFPFTDKDIEAVPLPDSHNSQGADSSCKPRFPFKSHRHSPWPYSLPHKALAVLQLGKYVCFSGKTKREGKKTHWISLVRALAWDFRNVCELNQWLLLGLTRHHSPKSVAPDCGLRGIARHLCIHIRPSNLVCRQNTSRTYQDISVIDDIPMDSQSVTEFTVDIYHYVLPNLGILKA